MAKLYFYYSSMNAGKSTTLLQANYNYKERGMNTMLFIPEIDNRFEKGTIHSRIGLSAKATIVNKKFNILEYLKDCIASHNKKPNCLLVDEAQFMTKAQIIQLSDCCDHFNIPVLAYGLRSDFQGELFEGSKALFAYADELVEIKTVCHCGKKATMNMRIDEDGRKVQVGEQVMIGGNDTYVATCRNHFKDGICAISTQKATV